MEDVDGAFGSVESKFQAVSDPAFAQLRKFISSYTFATRISSVNSSLFHSDLSIFPTHWNKYQLLEPC